MDKSTFMFWQTQVSRFRWLRYMEARSGLSEWKQRRKYRLAHQKAVIASFLITISDRDHDLIDTRTFYTPLLSHILSIQDGVKMYISCLIILPQMFLVWFPYHISWERHYATICEEKVLVSDWWHFNVCESGRGQLLEFCLLFFSTLEGRGHSILKVLIESESCQLFDFSW